MGPERMSDLAVASNGHCFFCLSKIKESGPNPALVLAKPINSLQYLTRYLKMDLRKVFNDKGQVSPELLAKVEKARLNVELCEECRCVSERFSKAYRQLEKLELELGSTLRQIHGKLVGADATGKLRSSTVRLNSNWNGLLEVLDVLRAEAIQKCSRRLADTPRVTLQNLTKKELRAKQRSDNYRTNHNRESSQLPAATHAEFESDRGLKARSFKRKFVNVECVSDNNDGNYLPDDIDSSLDKNPMEDGLEAQEDTIDSDLNADENILSDDEDVKVCMTIKAVSQSPGNMLGTGKCSINSETWKRKCNTCQLEYNNYQGFWSHYRKVHLKLRYKCVSCNKLFTDERNLRRHQRTSRSCSTTESPPKYNCHLCEKGFAFKQTLQTHLDGVHEKVFKYSCSICGNKYKTKVHLFQHRRQAHPPNADGKVLTKKGEVMVDKIDVSRISKNMLNGKCSINPETGKRKCNECQVEFNSYGPLRHHYRAVHLKIRYKCVSCNKLFINKDTLERHQRTSQSCSTTKLETPKYNCNFCEKSFTHKHVLKRHLDGAHYNLMKYQCDLCKNKFNTDKDLRSHRKYVHRMVN